MTPPAHLLSDEISIVVNKENEKYKNKTAEYLARIRYNLRRLAAGKCLYPACKNPNDAGQYCRDHRLHLNKRAVEARAKRMAKRGEA